MLTPAFASPHENCPMASIDNPVRLAPHAPEQQLEKLHGFWNLVSDAPGVATFDLAVDGRE